MVKDISYSVKESIIMEKYIAVLLEVSHIEQMSGGHWLFKALITSHQESIYDIVISSGKFAWLYPSKSSHPSYLYPIQSHVVTMTLDIDSAIDLSFGLSTALKGTIKYKWTKHPEKK